MHSRRRITLNRKLKFSDRAGSGSLTASSPSKGSLKSVMCLLVLEVPLGLPLQEHGVFGEFMLQGTGCANPGAGVDK